MLCGIFGGITQCTLVEKASKGEGRKRQESESATAAPTPELAVTAEKPPLEPSGPQDARRYQIRLSCSSAIFSACSS